VKRRAVYDGLAGRSPGGNGDDAVKARKEAAGRRLGKTIMECGLWHSELRM
jgi:hypothetical protein